MARADVLLAAQAKTAQLQEGIRTLTQRLKDEVAVRQPELLEQAASLRDAEDALQVRKNKAL